MSEYLIQEETLTGIADAIRGKTGGTASIHVSNMAEQIEGIETGGGEIDALIDRSITEVSSNATSVGNYAFSYCSALTSASFQAATNIENSAFYLCSALTSVSFPAATNIEISAFYSCSALTSVSLPAATNIGNSAFNSCSALTSVSFPAATSIGEYVFMRCSALTSVSFPAATSIGEYAFYFCSELTSLLLRNTEKVCTLRNANAFASSGISAGTGYIYVPSALIEDYKAATNWSTYADQFRALEDYTVDGTTTGELDPDKI